VNTFVKDASDANPLIRALAVRTMGCIRVDRITEYLCEPLSRALRDEDPYVRKTAAVCVAKLYDIAPELVVERGFLEILHDLISDSNPSVVANGVAALSEIAETSGKDVMRISASVLQKLLAALNECTEWGQVFILDSLAKYTPADGREAEGIIERVTPRLQHANSAVVMSAIKVILNYMELMGSQNSDAIRALTRKLAPPLVTLLNSEPEIQYVALRNINLIVQKRPHILESEIKVFFCKYNDPIYVKMEKLEIIIKLVSEKNIDQVLAELKEYATEVDVDFVRKAVSAIGRCAVKLERAAERCIGVLLELIQTKVNYVVQESVIVIKDIFRRYPNRYESIIATLCDNLDTLDEPLAKASMIWIIGEYAERIDNADELLDTFLETFEEEDPAVQLQLLTATVKCFLKNPEDTQDMVQRVLDMATEESDNPDLRDRGFIYWRLLSTDTEAAKLVVLGDKPVIEDDTFKLDPSLLNILTGQIATLSSIYHKPPESFVVRRGAGLPSEDEDDDSDDDDEGAGAGGDDAAYEDDNDVGDSAAGGGGVDLLDMGALSVNEAPARAGKVSDINQFACLFRVVVANEIQYVRRLHRLNQRLRWFVSVDPKNRVVLKLLLDFAKCAARFVWRLNSTTFQHRRKLVPLPSSSTKIHLVLAPCRSKLFSIHRLARDLVANPLWSSSRTPPCWHPFRRDNRLPRKFRSLSRICIPAVSFTLPPLLILKPCSRPRVPWRSPLSSNPGSRSTITTNCMAPCRICPANRSILIASSKSSRRTMCFLLHAAPFPTRKDKKWCTFRCARSRAWISLPN